MKKAISIFVLLVLAVFSFSCSNKTVDCTAVMAGNDPIIAYTEKGFSIFEAGLNKTLTLTNTDYESITITVYSENGKSCTLSAAKGEISKTHAIGGMPSAAVIEADGAKKAYALSEKGLSQLLITINRIKRLYNPDLDVCGILITMYNSRLLLSMQVMAELKKHYDDKLFETKISRNVKLTEAPGFGRPAFYHDKSSKGAKEYIEVAKELITRI